MIYWVDIEDAQGVRQGYGPILHVLSWTHTPRLDAAGTFSFTMPADDPRRAALRVKRIARCWTVAGGQVQHLGAGIINSIQATFSPEGAPTLTISGDDLLHELTYRTVGELSIADDSWFHPNEFFVIGLGEDYRYEDDDEANGFGKEDSLTYYSADLAIDYAPGDTTTRESDWRANSYDRRIVIKAPMQFEEIRWVLNGPVATPTLDAYYWDVASGTYESLAISEDTTKIGDYSWQQNGVMKFTPPATWGIKEGDVGYKICFKNNPRGCPADIYDISVRGARPTETVLGPIMALAPTGWTLDAANGYSEIAGFQEYGPNVISNPSFETYTGTQDDGATDTFANWTNEEVTGTARIEATATASESATAVKISHLNYPLTYTDYLPHLQQAIPVEPGAAYLFEADSRGDGSYDAYYAFSNDGNPDKGLRVLSYQWTGIRGTTWGQHRQIVHIPPGMTSAYLELRGVDMYCSGSAYWDNLSLRQIIGGGDVQLKFASETVLEALIRVTETNGEHFILSPSGRQVLWLRNDVRSTGVRCVADVDPQAVEDADDIALIANLTEDQSAYELISRVYPFGGGTGDERATLAYCTRAVPSGYTLDTANNCLVNATAEAAYGRIDKRLDLPDVVVLNDSPAQLRYAANSLYDRAYTYLKRHSATDTTYTTGDVPRAYRITLAKCDRALLPGHTVHVEYERWYRGTRTISIDRDLWILAATTRVDESGIHTVALECSTTDAAPMTDARLLADLIKAQRAMRGHKPGVG